MSKRLPSLFILLIISFTSTAANYSTPTERVKDTIDRVITILKDQTHDRDTKWENIAKVIKDGFDFRSMSQSVLATHWKKASPSERERFAEFFSQYLEEVYRSKIEGYTNEKIIYVDENIRGNRAVVKTLIVTSTVEIPINYRLKNNDGEWFVYDVVIEGISLVSNYRNTFAAIVKNEGMNGLLNDIQRRIDKYKAAKAATETTEVEAKKTTGD